jgi:hypothetical protein
MFGHLKYNCDKMAIYLNLRDNENKVDEKLKAKLQANFSANEDQRCIKKMAKLRGTVRQLYTIGQFEAGDQLWNSLLPEPMSSCTEISTDNPDVSDSDISTQS